MASSALRYMGQFSFALLADMVSCAFFKGLIEVFVGRWLNHDRSEEPAARLREREALVRTREPLSLNLRPGLLFPVFQVLMDAPRDFSGNFSHGFTHRLC